MEEKYLCLLHCCLTPEPSKHMFSSSDCYWASDLGSNVFVHDVWGTISSQGSHHLVGDEVFCFLVVGPLKV